ncbi:MAG: hypothetical protein H6709_13215 [Kofleriaceae bacterium]|nr:hypothetical protein [Kofleriaceae bacterium]
MNERAFVIGVLAVFAAMAAAVALRSYAEAAFLHQYGARWLPYLLVSQAVAFAAGATLYDVATARASLPWVDTALTVGLTGAALAAPALVARGGSWPFAVALVVISISQVVGLAVWNAICASVGGRDARRGLPRAGAAATAGGAVAGLGAGLLIPRLGADVVPYVAGGLAAAVPVLVALLRRELGRGGAPGAATPAGQSASAISDDHRRVLRWLAAAAVLEAAVATSIEFSFGASMKARYHGADLATAVALFYGGTNALLLLLQITLVPRLLVTQRQPFTVSVHPITVVVGLGGLLALPGFAVLAVLRTVEHVLRAATSRTGQEISLSPLPPVARARWKVLLRGAATPLGAALASAALIAAGAAALAEPRAVAAVTAAVGLIWLGAARGSARAFVAVLAAPLGMKRVAQARRAEGLDLEQLHRLVTAAGADDPQVARLARAELTRVGGGADEITAHLDHDEPRVRAALYALAARRPSLQARAELRAAAAIEDDDDALPAAIEALAAHGDGEAIARLGERATLDPAAARAVRARPGPGRPRRRRRRPRRVRRAGRHRRRVGGAAGLRPRRRHRRGRRRRRDRPRPRRRRRGPPPGPARRAAAGRPAAIRALLDGLVVDDADAHGAIAGLGVDDAAHLGAPHRPARRRRSRSRRRRAGPRRAGAGADRRHRRDAPCSSGSPPTSATPRSARPRCAAWSAPPAPATPRPRRWRPRR